MAEATGRVISGLKPLSSGVVSEKKTCFLFARLLRGSLRSITNLGLESCTFLEKSNKNTVLKYGFLLLPGGSDRIMTC